MNYPIYLDYNATTPVDAQVLAEMLPYFSTHFGNSSSRYHAFGWKADEAVKEARKKVAEIIGASEKEIIFTSGATESINLAIKGAFEANFPQKNHIITLATEHKAVLDTCEHLEKLGAKITYLLPDKLGIIAVSDIENAITSDTFLLSIMTANNETGVIQPMQEISELARKNNILFHTDATQAVGKIPVNVLENKVDLLSFSGHKLYAPKGVGALFIKNKVKLISQQDGGNQERNLRAGTLNVAGIVGFGKACEISFQVLDNELVRLNLLRNKLEKTILKTIPNTAVNGNLENRIANTTNINFGKIDGEKLLISLNEIAISNGSACNSASTKPSHVLKALGLSDELAFSSLRFSLGRFTTEREIDLTIEHIKKVVENL